MAYQGIDYGLGQTNIDHATGIRYGVISSHAVGQAWYDDSEADYGDPHCPKCGNEADTPDKYGESFADGVPDDYTKEKYEASYYVCVTCKHFFGGESAFGDDPIGFSYDRDGYLLTSCLDSDIMIIKSPYYTYGVFCSPCVPGGVSLPDDTDTPATDDISADLPRAYCLGHDWFETGKAPYRVFKVDDDTEVQCAS